MRWMLILLGCVVLPACRAAPHRGAVASPEPLAAEVGVEVLRQGGNAVDAAVAMGFALAVTLPSAGNIGGGGFMLVHRADEQVAIDYRELAPAGASWDMYLGEDGEVLTGLSRYGILAAGVPGTVHGLWTAHERYGSLPWADLLQPALRLAEDGWIIDRERARRMGFGSPFAGKEGDLFRQPELAATLRRIASEGPAGFYEGRTAELIVAEMGRRGGLITAEDLRGYRSVLREPVSARIGDLRVVSMPPPSSGGVALIQMLKMAGLEGGPGYVPRVAEIERKVFIDRARYLGDPDHVDVPVSRLISDEYIRSRAAESEETTHFSVVDRWGNAVANTYTLNSSFGCGVVVEGAGFLLNNEMDDFSARPGVPNIYGVTGGEANAIAPGKRMLSSMTPTFVYRGDRLWLVLGSPGGPTIFTTVFQVIQNRAVFGMTLAEAVESPRFHHQWPSREGNPIYIELGREIPEETQRALRELGYSIVVRSPLGDVQAIEIGEGEVIAVSDSRRIGRSLLE